jgi:hypothetical protein
MTCFWDGLIAGLGKKSLEASARTPIGVVRYLKERNCYTAGVLWNGVALALAEQETNYHYIQNFDPATIIHGYLCSAADPFLLLVGQLTQRSIEYDFNGTLVHKSHYRRPVLYFRASHNHFEYGRARAKSQRRTCR